MSDQVRNELDAEKTQGAGDLLTRNLEWFREQFRGYHAQLKSYTPMSQLEDEGDGWHNLKFSGQPLYEPSAKEYIETQLEQFSDHPPHLLFAPLQPENFDRYAANFLHSLIERLHGEGIEFHTSIFSPRAYYLFVFGFGLGAHIQEMVKQSNCQSLVIIEPNLEFIAQSLRVFDWRALHDVIEERGGKLDLVISDNDDFVYDSCRAVIRGINPCSMDGALFVTHYNNEMFVRVQSKVKSTSQIILSGLGFYFDETVMIANTHENLHQGEARMIRYAVDANRKYPAFIVASGPSLDNDIPWLQQNAENAVIFSCGTAIMPLMKAGIVPDFQVEIENIPELYDLMVDTAKHLDISKTHLLTTTTVDARVPGFFDEVSYFFRPALASYPIFARKDDVPLENGSPTVTNAAFALAQHFGFRELFLFGVDMGSKVEGLMHSRGAWQNSDEGCEMDIEFNVPVRGNLGGSVYTSNDMNWTRDELELAIKHFYRGRLYYNCSDGAYIKGTVAKHARSIRFPQHAMPKEAEVQGIVGKFRTYPIHDFEARWSDAHAQEVFKDFFARLEACLDDPEKISSRRSMTEINKILLPKVEENMEPLGIAMTFRGSLWQALLGAEFYLNRVDGDEDVARAEEIFKEETLRLFRRLRDEAVEDLGHMTERPWTPRARILDIKREVFD